MGADAHSPTLSVEVAYATLQKQTIVRLEVPAGCTVEQAIEQSRIREQFPGLIIDADRVGVFSRKVSLEHEVQEGDRVEIYRSLIADPKESRRKRAAGRGKAETGS